METSAEERVWFELPPRREVLPGPIGETVRFLSYKLLTNKELKGLVHTDFDYNYLNTLVCREIISFDADILGLQNIEDFNSWRSFLATHGYDSLFKKKTSKKRLDQEGNLIAYKRSKYQLFKSLEVELNEAIHLPVNLSTVEQEQIITDDVGLITFLQPWEQSQLKSGICIGCFMISDTLRDAYCRGILTQYFTQKLEEANTSLQLPIMIATALGDEPTSRAYHVLRTGRIPIAAAPPRKITTAPKCEYLSRSTIRITWERPLVKFAEPVILGYRLSWKAGGSAALGFMFQKEVSVGDCLQYEEKLVDGVRHTEILDEMFCIISNLSSEVPYEFRVLAYNEIGESDWSDVSLPFVLANPAKAPKMPELVHFLTLEQMAASASQRPLQSDDTFVTSIMNVANEIALEDDRSLFQISRGRVLPRDVNPRSGWQVKKDSPTKTKVVYIAKKEHSKNKLKMPESEPEGTYDVDSTAIQSILLDGRDVITTIGGGSKRQVHYLGLRSAYEGYSIAGEPLFTQSLPSTPGSDGIKCTDYIFYSEQTLRVGKLLMLPRLVSITGDDYRLPAAIFVKGSAVPPQSFAAYFNKHESLHLDQYEFDSAKSILLRELEKAKTNKSMFWAGMWQPAYENNLRRKNVYLPTYSFGSSHLALCCEFELISPSAP